MSQTHPLLTVRTWYDYAEQLATEHVAIRHGEGGATRYTRMFLEQWLAEGHSKLDGGRCSLIAEPYDTGFIDNKSNNIQAVRLLAWMVVKKVTPGDREAAIDAEAECEEVALDILGRIRRDRLTPGSNVFADVRVEEAEGSSVPMALNGAWAGYRVQVPVQNVERRAVYRADRWL